MFFDRPEQCSVAVLQICRDNRFGSTRFFLDTLRVSSWWSQGGRFGHCRPPRYLPYLLYSSVLRQALILMFGKWWSTIEPAIQCSAMHWIFTLIKAKHSKFTFQISVYFFFLKLSHSNLQQSCFVCHFPPLFLFLRIFFLLIPLRSFFFFLPSFSSFVLRLVRLLNRENAM